ncbi:hypothetical protein [Actinomycetospora soli]|uniref:hypothetical protein n=1 Tax=Actinomycetospora soli TaxID=2893887 RepID=UPI001E2F3178|nr:hypothetical protein [Actinomycetospora soli]MCD2191645.1 hypothetical protein [Actinomycetospora soli]
MTDQSPVQLDDAQRTRLATAAAGMPVAPGSVLPRDVDVDQVAAAQLTRADLAALTAANKSGEIEQARQQGRLLGLTLLPDAFDVRTAPAVPEGQLTREDVQRMSAAGQHDEIDQARRAGRLTHLLGQHG